MIVANSCQEFGMKAFESPFISKIALSTTGRLKELCLYFQNHSVVELLEC